MSLVLQPRPSALVTAAPMPASARSAVGLKVSLAQAASAVISGSALVRQGGDAGKKMLQPWH